MANESTTPDVRCDRCHHPIRSSNLDRCPECGEARSPLLRFNQRKPPLLDYAIDLKHAIERLQVLQPAIADLPARLEALRLAGVEPEERRFQELLATVPLAMSLYRLLRRSESPPREAICVALDALPRCGLEALDDPTAILLLPNVTTLVDLYQRLRELGYDPFQTLDCILPRARQQYRLS